jgi:hypothetical protein
MRFDRSSFVVSLAAFLLVFALGLGLAQAAGSISFTKREVQESNGGWHLMMTIVYGGKPNTAHVPMRFSFTPISILENYLDDAHGEKPQKRKIPLVGQVPLNESVDVDFADSRGKLYDRTKFDFTITRAHGFSAGDYTVVVHRADGAPVGASQTLSLLGDNPVIDRRTMSFVGNIKKEKPAAAPADSAAAANEAAPKAADNEPAATAANEPAAAPGPAPSDPAAAEKVPPSSHGCGCRLGSRAPSAWPLSTDGSPAWAAIGIVALTFCRLRRRPHPL